MCAAAGRCPRRRSEPSARGVRHRGTFRWRRRRPSLARCSRFCSSGVAVAPALRPPQRRPRISEQRHRSGRVALQWMRRISMLGVQPQIQRKERQTETLVLLHVPQLVSPQRVGRLAREYEDMSEGYRGVPAARQHEMRETAIAHVEEAAVTKTRPRERQPAEKVPDRVGVVADEPARDATARRYRAPPAAPRSRARVSSRGDRSAR